MRNKWVYSGLAVLAFGTAGCTVGQGAPDGWRYLRSGPVAVAHPKTWQQKPAGVALRRSGGRTEAQLSIVTAAASRGTPARRPAGRRSQTVRIAGRSARVVSYLSPAPDGRLAVWVNVTLQTRDGRPVEVRAWTLAGQTVSRASGHGTSDDPLLLREIVNSIELN